MSADCATCGELLGNPDCEVCKHDGWVSGREPEPRELNWQDCRAAATDAAANLAHCYNSVSTPELSPSDKRRWVEEQVLRAMRVGRDRGLRHFDSEQDETINVTGDQFS